MILSAVVAVVIFIGLTREGARYRPVVWFGAVLVAFGAVGFFDSLNAVQHHRVVFAGLVYHMPLSPLQALIGYSISTVLGLIGLFPPRLRR
jgi:cobalamin biosynthesis protein CobD/CbiB